MIQYKRIILTGSLTTKSNLHIGTGADAVITNEDINKSKTKNKTRYNAIHLDASDKNKPYIPASSLRGYLRNIIENHEGKDAINTLFGMERQPTDKKETGNIGLIRIYDALWDTSQGDYQQQIISQTRIDRLSNTAKQHQLSSHAIVQANSTFKVELELDNINQQQLTLLLKALNTLGEEYDGKLGKAKTGGQGQLSWEHASLRILTQEKFKEWLSVTSEKDLDTFYQNQPDVPEINALIEATIHPFINKHYRKFTIKLTANSPILINDPEATKAENKKREEHKEKEHKKETMDHIFMQQQGYAIIPGSTLKGWLRARCEKILLTLINKQDKPPKNSAHIELIESLFGNTDRQGLIEFNSAKVLINNDEIHQQTFNAIDRFTGGVKEHALYNAEAIWPKQAFVGSINYQHNKLTSEMKLLLLFALRDAMEGDLVLGWGKSKGFGRLTLLSDEYPDWQSLQQALAGNTELQQWQDKLNEALGIKETQGEPA